ncbi:hypothetical protein GCM10023231_39430 [Olivibacter ginsenosidimutans]|uniref:Uncharacterized protein n=1 Tax=Olivibacter ginsenosidimutans TaxID=1176537 RepID=A0ABP9C888_9SPHI
MNPKKISLKIPKKTFGVRKTAFGVNFSLVIAKMIYFALYVFIPLGTYFFYKLG